MMMSSNLEENSLNQDKDQIIDYLKHRESNYNRGETTFVYDDNLGIFPGALLKFNKKTHKLALLTHMHLNKYNMCINKDANKKDNKLQTDIIEEYSKHGAFDAINKLIKNIPKEPTNFSATLHHIDSINNLKFNFGIRFNCPSMIRFFNSFELEFSSYQTNALLIISSEYFTVDYHYLPEKGVFNFFNDNTSLDEIKRNISEDEIPLFASTFHYGSEILISIQTNLDYRQLEARLNIQGPCILNLGAFFSNLSSFSDLHFHFAVNGLPINLAGILNNASIDQYINAINTNDNCFGNPIMYSLYSISDCNLFQSPTQIQIQHEENQDIKRISILHVISDSRFKKTIDLSFINQYRGDFFTANYCQINETNFKKSINDSRYLQQYDILLLGGADGCSCYSKFDTEIVNKIKDWHRTKGFILFLHDFINKERIELFRYFIDTLGFDDKVNAKSNYFSEIAFCDGCSEFLDKRPCRTRSTVKISKTHESVKYKKEFMLIKSSENWDVHYLCANFKTRVGDCSIGHSLTIEQYEEDLFLNIIYQIIGSLDNITPINNVQNNDSSNNANNEFNSELNSVEKESSDNQKSSIETELDEDQKKYIQNYFKSQHVEEP